MDNHDQDDLDQANLTKRYPPWSSDRKASIACAWALLIIAIGVGLPLWWRSTKVYQAQLPADRIKALLKHHQQMASGGRSWLNLRLDLSMVSLVPDDVLSRSQLRQLHEGVCQQLVDSSKRLVAGRYPVECSPSTRVEKLPMMTDVDDDKLSLHLLDHILKSMTGDDLSRSSSSIYTLVLLPTDLFNRFRHLSSSSTGSIELPSGRYGADKPLFLLPSALQANSTVLLARLPSDGDRQRFVAAIGDLFMDVLVVPIDMPSTSSPLNHHQHRSTRQAAQTESPRHKPLVSSANYQVLLTILTDSASSSRSSSTSNSRSSSTLTVATKSLISTNPTQWLSQMVEPAFQRWLPQVRVELVSQRLHAVEVERVKPSHRMTLRSNNGTTITSIEEVRYYTQHDLSDLINGLESYFSPGQGNSLDDQSGSSAKVVGNSRDEPLLNVLLLISSNPSQPKLRFQLAGNNRQPTTMTDTALVPNWGGLLVVDASDDLHQSHRQVEAAASKLVALIRSHLGLPFDDESAEPVDNSMTSSIKPIVRLDKTTLYQPGHWELNRWFLQRSIESFSEAVSTLTALLHFLDKFPNIVINQDIARHVYQSVDLLEQVVNSQSESLSIIGGDCPIRSTFALVQQALGEANGAFFDHTLLGLLYFQDDQKYGIYVPLFVPIGFALAATLARLVKHLAGRL